MSSGNADARTRIERAMQRADELARSAKQIPAPVPCEAELIAILAAPLTGGATAGFAHKEALLRAEVDRLSHADCRQLAIRLRNASPDDPLTPLFQRWTAERRTRLIDFLDDSRRREALRREAELRSRKG
jgi:hypothetical protein